MKVLLLLSGGLDSSTTLAWLSDKGYEVYAITFDYGQRNRFEIACAQDLASKYKVIEHVVIKLETEVFGEFSSLNSDINIDKYSTYTPKKDFIPNTYFPLRNSIFLSYASAFAESRGIEKVFFSCNKQDTDYPDCSSNFVNLFNQAINSGSPYGNITIQTPLIDKTKSEIISLAKELSLNLGETQSCYDPGAEGQPCLNCDACLLRESAFDALNIMDPLTARYSNTKRSANAIVDNF